MEVDTGPESPVLAAAPLAAEEEWKEVGRNGRPKPLAASGSPAASDTRAGARASDDAKRQPAPAREADGAAHAHPDMKAPLARAEHPAQEAADAQRATRPGRQIARRRRVLITGLSEPLQTLDAAREVVLLVLGTFSSAGDSLSNAWGGSLSNGSGVFIEGPDAVLDRIASTDARSMLQGLLGPNATAKCPIVSATTHRVYVTGVPRMLNAAQTRAALTRHFASHGTEPLDVVPLQAKDRPGFMLGSALVVFANANSATEALKVPTRVEFRSEHACWPFAICIKPSQSAPRRRAQARPQANADAPAGQAAHAPQAHQASATQPKTVPTGLRGAWGRPRAPREAAQPQAANPAVAAPLAQVPAASGAGVAVDEDALLLRLRERLRADAPAAAPTAALEEAVFARLNKRLEKLLATELKQVEQRVATFVKEMFARSKQRHEKRQQDDAQAVYDHVQKEVRDFVTSELSTSVSHVKNALPSMVDTAVAAAIARNPTGPTSAPWPDRPTNAAHPPASSAKARRTQSIPATAFGRSARGAQAARATPGTADGRAGTAATAPVGRLDSPRRKGTRPQRSGSPLDGSEAKTPDTADPATPRAAAAATPGADGQLAPDPATSQPSSPALRPQRAGTSVIAHLEQPAAQAGRRQ